MKTEKTEQKEQRSLNISQEKLLAFVRAMIGGSRGREDDEHPLPPGPWDPVIRVALERINFLSPHTEAFGHGVPWVWGPHPEPWNVTFASILARYLEIFDVIGRGHGLGEMKPVPWKVAFASILAKHPEIFDVIGGGHSFGEEVALNPQPLPPRFAFLVSVAQAVTTRAELLQEIADATLREGEQQGIIIVSGYTSRFSDDWCGNGFRLKWPFPGPRPHWFTNELDGIDLMVMAMQFEQAAKETFSPDLRQNFADISAKFVEAGLSKMQ